MGKTRTTFIEGAPEKPRSGKKKYEEKRKIKEKKTAKQEKRKKLVTKVGLKGGERIKVVAAETPVEEPKEKLKKKKQIKKASRKRGNKYIDARSKIDKTKLYSLPEAIKLVKETSYSSFDGTMELHIVTKKEGLNFNVKLPYSAGKSKKIEIANTKTIEKLKKGKIDFDILLSTPEMMQKLVPFAKILGPKGLMPNPKNQTLIKGPKDAKKFSGNSITIKTEKKSPLIHTIVGKVSQKEKELEENTLTILDTIGKKQTLKAYLTSTMGPSVKLEV